jgi:hypothetical protein
LFHDVPKTLESALRLLMEQRVNAKNCFVPKPWFRNAFGREKALGSLLAEDVEQIGAVF